MFVHGFGNENTDGVQTCGLWIPTTSRFCTFFAGFVTVRRHLKYIERTQLRLAPGKLAGALTGNFCSAVDLDGLHAQVEGVSQWANFATLKTRTPTKFPGKDV